MQINIPDPIYSEEAEQAVIGAVLVNHKAFLSLNTILDSDSFFFLKHQHIWRAIADTYEAHGTIDYMLVNNALKNIGVLDDIGGPAYLTQVINATPTSMHAVPYAYVVRGAKIRRDMIQALAEAIPRVANLDQEVDKALESAVTRISKAKRSNRRKRGRYADEIMADVYDEFERYVNTQESIQGLPTSLRDLTALTGGFRPGELTILAARPGMGKSAYLAQLAYHIATQTDAGVLLFLNEMTERSTAWRWLSQTANVNATLLRDPVKVPPMSFDRITTAIGAFEALKLYVNDDVSATTADMEEQIVWHQRLWGDNLIVIWDGMYRGEPLTEYSNNHERYGALSRELKTLALRNDIPVVASHQLSRKVESRADKMPRLSDLRESGNIEEDADYVWFILRQIMYDDMYEFPNEAKFGVAKARHSQPGTVTTYFEPSTLRFYDGQAKHIDLRDL